MIIQVSYMSANRSLLGKYNIHVYGSVSLHSIITSVIHRKIGSSTLLWQRYPLSVTVLDLEQPFLFSFNLIQTLWRIVGNKYFTLVSFFIPDFRFILKYGQIFVQKAERDILILESMQIDIKQQWKNLLKL